MKKQELMNKKISSTIGKDKSKTPFNETTMIGDINNQKTPFNEQRRHL